MTGTIITPRTTVSTCGATIRFKQFAVGRMLVYKGSVPQRFLWLQGLYRVLYSNGRNAQVVGITKLKITTRVEDGPGIVTDW